MGWCGKIHHSASKCTNMLLKVKSKESIYRLFEYMNDESTLKEILDSYSISKHYKVLTLSFRYSILLAFIVTKDVWYDNSIPAVPTYQLKSLK